MTASQSPGDALGQPPGKSIAGAFTLTTASLLIAENPHFGSTDSSGPARWP